MLSLAYITTEGARPVEQIEAAAAAGFDAVGLRAMQPTGRPLAHELIGQRPLIAAIEAACRANGITVLDLEVITLTPDFSVADHKAFLEVAARVGARYVQVVCEDTDLARAGDNLARIAAAAADLGVLAALEFMAFRSANNLRTALRLIDRAGTDNVRLLVDTLHLCRSGGTAEELAAVPPERIGYAQLCDAPAIAPADLIQEARFDRLYPGEGGLPLRRICATLPADLPISIEVPRKTMTDLGPRLQAMEAARWVKLFYE